MNLICGNLRELTRPQALLLMQRIKQALDPEGLLNPGKMFMTAAAATAARP